MRQSHLRVRSVPDLTKDSSLIVGQFLPSRGDDRVECTALEVIVLCEHKQNLPLNREGSLQLLTQPTEDEPSPLEISVRARLRKEQRLRTLRRAQGAIDLPRLRELVE